MIDNDLKEFIRAIPKCELHVHFDLPYPETLLHLADRNDVELPFSDVDSATQFFDRDWDLQNFLPIWETVVSVIRTEQDYVDIALSIGADMRRQNILRREAMFTYAAGHEQRGVALETVLNGLTEGRRAVKQQYGVDLFYIANIDRRISSERSLRYVNDISKYRERTGILAVGLDCAEVGFPAATHASAFKRAGELGFKRCAHSGEEDGAQSVWSSLRELHVDRIDHGVRSIDDEDLVDYLALHKIALTVCPLSNMPWVYPTIVEGPLKRLMDKGVPVTVNSDDSTFVIFNGKPAGLIENFEAVADAFGLSADDVVKLVRNSFAYSFASMDEKQDYLRQLESWLVENRIAA